MIRKLLYPSMPAGRTGLALFLLRVFVGVAFCFHGSGKATDVEAFAAEFQLPVALAALASTTQLVGGLLLIVGLATPAGAGAIAGTMTVATLKLLSRGEPFVNPHGHSYEASAFYWMASMVILALGPGVYSFDGWLLTSPSVRRGVLRVGVGLMLAITLHAQEPTRTSLIQEERKQKALHLEADTPTRTENVMRQVKEGNYLEKVSIGWHGIRAKVGNMVTGSGFAGGPEYYRDDLLNGAMGFRAAAQVSTRRYQKYESGLTFPKLAGGKLNADIRGVYRNYGSLQYYGTGASRPKDLRANYRLEDTAFEGMLSARPISHLIVGGFAGYLFTNVGPGTDSRFASADTAFGADPGMNRQSNFLRDGVFAQWDYRDNPFGPKNGGNYVMQYTWYKDNRFDLYGFRRLDVDLQQYVGFFNRTRVIALRAKTTLTETDGANQVPFYLQPMLGGSDDLRGFRNFRFSDRNSLVFNAEYRWEVFSGMDGAVFADAGKVFARRGQLNFRDLESSVGFGLRFNARNATFLRLDVGFSHEGFQFWIKFNDVFQPRRFGVGNGQPVY